MSKTAPANAQSEYHMPVINRCNSTQPRIEDPTLPTEAILGKPGAYSKATSAAWSQVPIENETLPLLCAFVSLLTSSGKSGFSERYLELLISCINRLSECFVRIDTLANVNA
jgi:hypothetical protein